MENKEFIPDEKWEQAVLEKMAEETAAEQLLDICEDCAIHLAAALANARRFVQDPEEDDGEKAVAVAEAMQKVGKMAVLLDALQLRFGDTTEAEVEFLQAVESCFS